MGGIKNRDEKRKAAKVFASGGGGGAKGPSIVDKRGQDEKCPHCDRVFKQNNRLKEHVAKQHADNLEQPKTQQTARSHEQHQMQPATTSSSKGDVAAAPKSSPSAPFAKASLSASASRPSHAVDGPNSSNTTGSNGKMFDVGSRGGFYTEKSPRLMLADWCTQQNRPKPRFKAVPVKPDREGGYRARVVLPDSKFPGTDKDIVVWLPANHAADSEEEALQRGAVAALQEVAGNRSLDYVLPQAYRQLWNHLKNQACERAEAQARAAAAAAEHKARQAAIKSAAAARAPVAVVMSHQQRQAVEQLMQGPAVGTGDSSAGVSSGLVTLDGSGWSNSSSDGFAQGRCASDRDRDVNIMQGLVKALITAGFSAADSAAAVTAVGTQAGAAAAAASAAANAAAASGGRSMTRVERPRDGLQPYLNWLCLHMPVERLPARYRPGGSSGTVGVLRLNKSATKLSTAIESSTAAAAGTAATGAAAAWCTSQSSATH
eukprot:GHRR01002587.1.p2 GENE.GHRR01002587.1~~GHRR01002587.1.p2  ORF type:complete len:488 (+),score=215.76 GHRR01002587.1:456-1919(+)